MEKRKLSRTGNMLITFLLILSLCGACYSGWMLYQTMSEYSQGSAAYHKIDKDALVPAADGSEEETIDFDYLRNINPDIAGWISLADSEISYPVVYSYEKGNDWYLRHLFDGTYNNSGCIFLDSHNVRADEEHIVMYGHHMRNGTMFADVQKYESQEWYDTHREIVLDTPDGRWILYPAAGIFTTGTDPYVRFEFADDADFIQYVNYFTSGSTFVSDTVLQAGDRTALLSTCSYNVEDGRYALLCRMERAG
ncbi:MAG: class B sortase [Solobacterium sp.]|nr:class B sortase [Solobacterium sp.]